LLRTSPWFDHIRNLTQGSYGTEGGKIESELGQERESEDPAQVFFFFFGVYSSQSSVETPEQKGRRHLQGVNKVASGQAFSFSLFFLFFFGDG
jgi:hypothetical protein